MIIVNKPIEMIANFDIKGKVKPERFKLIIEDESTRVITIDRIISVNQIKELSTVKINYECMSLIDDIKRRYFIQFDTMQCKWTLIKW